MTLRDFSLKMLYGHPLSILLSFLAAAHSKMPVSTLVYCLSEMHV